MRLYAISDLHVGHAANRRAVEAISPQPDDWLILAGDVGDGPQQLAWALDVLAPRFAKLIWTPGNHELWTRPSSGAARGVHLYAELVALCRERGVLTPEDPYPLWQGEGGPHRIAPLFLLYDYTFVPPDVAPERAVEWAVEAGILCADEYLLHSDPFPSRAAWCEARCLATEQRLEQALAIDDHPLVLINHFPLRQELAVLPAIPRFSIWCGTRRTEEWHRRFRASTVLYGHLHIRRRTVIDGVRFEEVSLGYPRQWDEAPGLAGHLCQVLPGQPDS